jgi:peptide chain release factor 3
MARWITSENPQALRKFIDANAQHIAYDVVDAVAFLIGSAAQLRVAKELYPEVTFHAMREHGGRFFGDRTQSLRG